VALQRSPLFSDAGGAHDRFSRIWRLNLKVTGVYGNG
jgi:hypothetical protein